MRFVRCTYITRYVRSLASANDSYDILLSHRGYLDFPNVRLFVSVKNAHIAYVSRDVLVLKISNAIPISNTHMRFAFVTY